MLVFFYISIIISVATLILLFNLQTKKLNLKVKKFNYNSNYEYKKMCVFIIFDTFIGFIIMVSIVFIFPYLMWNLSPKGYQVEDKVLNSYDISPLSKSNNKIYVKQVYTSDNKKQYIINVDGILQTYDSNLVEIEENNFYKGQPIYKDVNLYSVYELIRNNIITEGVNDMYANVYSGTVITKFLGEKKQICVPENSMDK